MRRIKSFAVSVSLALTTLLALTPGGPALAETAATTIQTAQDANLGTILTGPNGMTLYLYTKDTPGVTNCYDQCAVNWPPLLLKQGEQPVAPAGVKGTLGTTTRKDGTIQATFNGWPLYYWVRDKVVGDTTGQNVGKVWFVLNPDGPTIKLAQDAKLGTIFTDANGMTLYVYTKDVPGTSNCYDRCAINWPPLLLKAGEQLVAPPALAGKLGTTMRKDGTQNVTFNGAPLYYWIRDKAVGETTGHKVGDVWFVVEPGLLLDTAGRWEQGQVAAAVRAGWVKSDANGSFRPESPITRAEFAQMLAAAVAAPAGTDFLAGQPEPNVAITRQEAIAMVIRALGQEAMAAQSQPALARFTDARSLTAQNSGLVGVAVQLGIVNGYPDNTLHGERTASRAEAVALIQRARSKMPAPK